MDKRRIRRILLWLGGALGLYALVGFLLVPALVKRQAVAYVERDLGHKLELAEVRLNPFTLSVELKGFRLTEPSGAHLVGFERLFVDFEAISLFRRAWTFSAIELRSPALAVEHRTDGSHNFSALLARLRKEPPEPERPTPRLTIARIRVDAGRIEVADLQAGADARLRLDPITFELADLSTLPSETAPYSLAARSPDGEGIQWSGKVSLNPFESAGKLTLQGWKLATFDRLLGKRIGLQKAEGQISASFEYRAGFAQGRPMLQISGAQATADSLALTGDGSTAPLLGLGRLAVTGGTFDLARRTLAIERVEISQGAIDLVVDARGRGNWTALELQPIGSTSPAVAPSAPTASAETSGQTPADANLWRVELAHVEATNLGVAYRDERAASASTLAFAEGRATLSASLELGDPAIAVTVSKVKAGAAQIALGQAGDKLALGSAELDIERIAAKSGEAHTRIDIDAPATKLRTAVAQRGPQSLRVDGLDAAAKSIALMLPAGPDASPGVELSGLGVDARGLGTRGSGARDLVELKSLTLGARSLRAGGVGPSHFEAEQASATIAGAVVRDPANGADIARIARLEATGAGISAAKRTIALERVVLADADAVTVLDAEGRSNWEALAAVLLPAPAPAATQARDKAPASKPAPAAPWIASAKLFEVTRISADYTDQRAKPAFSIAVQDVAGRLRNATSAGRTPASLEISGRIKDSGRFNAAGAVDLATYASDLKVKLDGISLTPAQPFIAARARLQLVSALASAEGRLRYGRPKESGAALVYEGTVGLDKVIVEETEPAAPFLSLEALRANQIRFSLGPDGLDVPDLRITRLATKLAIAEDQSINLAKVMRTHGTAPAPATPASAAKKPAPDAAKAEPAAAAPQPAGAEPVFPVSLSRIRIDDSVLEFSDLSLRPQLFNTRMHELKGVVTGVSTSRDSRARLELDARVDEFGAATIRGSMNPFAPRTFTEVDFDLRNIPMQKLTPYSSKFAGYRIASGTMTISLQYRVKNSALQGNNKILLDKLELGERVESPNALNLPLELAIAILKDSDGRIDIGLPVSGSLDDPQFSVAGLVWKALGNLLTRIVTAPFRALASLFGGGDQEALGAIDFDPGSDALRPPERQKLRTVAEALQKRPQLRITVRPGYASTADAEALRSIAVRRNVLLRSGIKLEPNEAPGPLDVGNPRTQQALDALFAERFGLPAARDLRASLAKPPPAAQPPAADAAAKPPANPAALQSIRVARTMADRLIAAQPVTEADLAELARRRGLAVVAEMRDGAKIDPTRVSSGEPRAAEPRNGAIVTELDLSTAK